jgi:hypothetical protein
MPFGTADICREVTYEFARELVDVGAFGVIKLVTVEVDNRSADHYCHASPCPVLLKDRDPGCSPPLLYR